MVSKSTNPVSHIQGIPDSDYGIALLWPAYTRYYLNLGEISSYPPGYKENGGMFCRNNPWIMIAETMLGRGDPPVGDSDLHAV